MRRNPIISLLAAGTVLAASAGPAAGAPKLAANPALPAYGQPVEIQLQDVNAFTPATRYSRIGNTILIDAQHLPRSFGPFPPDTGPTQVNLGELPPGNYSVQARLVDIGGSNETTALDAQLAVVPPQSWGAYLLPREPQAFSETHVVIKSAAYFDPASMRAAVSGNVVRVEFDYLADAPASGPAPPGMQAYGSVKIPTLAPGSYVVEAYGRPKAGGPYERYFTTPFTVASAVPVVEYYSATLGHYFVAAGADEIALLDRGGQGDWKRTGLSFDAWARAGDAPPGAVPVCRFYASGPNSHVYTGSAAECEELKRIEQAERARLAASGQPFPGWSYEGTAFWTVMPQQGQCPSGLRPVYRLYNDRAAQMDSNHRFTSDPAQRTATSVRWVDEGVHLCSPA
jgi:hypothetical protein